MQVDWSFDSGSVGLVQVIDDQTVALTPRRDYDHEGRNWAGIWVYFRLQGVGGRKLRLQFVDLTDEWNRQPSFSWGPRTRPMFSTDGRTWHRLTSCQYETRSRRLTVEHVADSDSLWVAYIEPYPLGRLTSLLAELEGRPGVQVGSLGTSVQGRPVPVVTVALPGQPARRHAWVVCRQHPWETGSSYAAEGLLRFLAGGSQEALAALSAATFHVVPVANPDGVWLGGTRYNALGYDLNRHYQEAGPDTARETYCLLEALREAAACGEPADVLVNVHNNNQEADDWVAGYGLPADDGRLQRFGHVLAQHTFFRGRLVDRAPAEAWLPGGGVAFIVEMRTGFVPALGRYVTRADQMTYGQGLAKALADFLGALEAAGRG